MDLSGLSDSPLRSHQRKKSRQVVWTDRRQQRRLPIRGVSDPGRLLKPAFDLDRRLVIPQQRRPSSGNDPEKEDCSASLTCVTNRRDSHIVLVNMLIKLLSPVKKLNHFINRHSCRYSKKGQ